MELNTKIKMECYEYGYGDELSTLQLNLSEWKDKETVLLSFGNGVIREARVVAETKGGIFVFVNLLLGGGFDPGLAEDVKAKPLYQEGDACYPEKDPFVFVCPVAENGERVDFSHYDEELEDFRRFYEPPIENPLNLEVLSCEPPGEARRRPLLFVHGMFHSAWVWAQNFLPYFAEHGYRSYAVSLRGHGASEGGERLQKARLMDYVADVRQVARSLPREPIVIGHSMGGMVVQRYFDEYSPPAAVLLAAAPPTGLLPGLIPFSLSHPWATLKTGITGHMRSIIETPELYRDLLFSAHTPREIVDSAYAHSGGESYAVFWELLKPLPNTLKFRSWRIPKLVLGAAQDRSVLPAVVWGTGRFYGAPATIFPEMGHSMMLEPGWKAVADFMLRWMNAI